MFDYRIDWRHDIIDADSCILQDTYSLWFYYKMPYTMQGICLQNSLKIGHHRYWWHVLQYNTSILLPSSYMRYHSQNKVLNNKINWRQVIIDIHNIYNWTILVTCSLEFWYEIPFTMQGNCLQNRLKTGHHKYWWHILALYKLLGRPRWLKWMRVRLKIRSCGFDPRRVGNILSWRLIMTYLLRSFSQFCWFK